MPDLKLQALDGQDLTVISAQCQDATVRVPDMAYQAREQRFALVANRFDWATAAAAKPTMERRRTGLRFERVTRVRSTGFDPKATDAVLVLLALQFEETSAPLGTITLQFAGGAAICLDVECVEAEMKDLGAAWSTRNKPDHT